MASKKNTQKKTSQKNNKTHKKITVPQLQLLKKGFLIAIAGTIILITSIALVYTQQTIFYIDTIRSKMSSLLETIITNNPQPAFLELSPSKKWINPYATLPKNLTKAGIFLFYKADRTKSLADIAQEALPYTSHYKRYTLQKAIKRYNLIETVTVPLGTILFIPYSLPTTIMSLQKEKKSTIIHTRGLYYTGHSIGNAHMLQNITKFSAVGINTIVFDAKDITGHITYHSNIPQVQQLATDRKRTIDNIDAIIRFLKAHDIYTIARIAVFQDHLLAKIKPKWAIRSARTGGRWNPGQKEIWCDPTNKNVQDYNIKIAIELAEKGVDEIQFDYIRFPTKGNLRDAIFAYDYGKQSNTATIAHFLKKAQYELETRNTNLSIDIFGIVAWEQHRDIVKTGQKIELLAQYCDVISPMLYPSHFNDNFRGHARPGDEPYYFIFTGTEKVQEKSGTTLVRPWLQAFGWRVSNYNASYIIEQIKACQDSEAAGYLFWNAANDYKTVYAALQSLQKGKILQSMK